MNPEPLHGKDDTSAGVSMRAALDRALHGTEGSAGALAPPTVPDHTLLDRIGHGAYGDVWLARSALGTMRAVKVVYRARFKENRPYEREFNGILKYEPISRSHEGLVQVLHVGRGPGCFYYVMELADDGRGVRSRESPAKKKEESSVTLPAPLSAPPSYTPRTLRSELADRQRLPPADAAQLVLRLASALAHLHTHGLVHRDIKPSNVIFVGGQPKLADIGLVTDVGSSQSFVGTEGFIPPEGPGTPQADLYGLGKLLYELATGRDRMEFPHLPPLGTPVSRRGGGASMNSNTSSGRRTSIPGDFESLMELNEVITRACAPDPKQRYANAAELQAELNLFLAGHSLRRTRTLERALGRLRKYAVAASVFLALAAVALWLVKNEQRHASERARQATDRARVEAESRAKEAVLRERAEAAERRTEGQLYTALLEQARATVRGGEMGQRTRALDALRRAAAISNSAELRREVMAALALPDLRFESQMPLGPDGTEPQLDPAFARVAVSRGRGPVEIRVVADNRLLATLPASTNLPVYVRRWTVDGRFLAVKRDYPDGGQTADWEVWDVAAERRVLLLRGLVRDNFSFHPRLPRCVVTHRTEGTTIRDLNTGEELVRLPQINRPHVLRFSPDGRKVAAILPRAPGMVVAIHDAQRPEAPELVASPHIMQSIIVEWHPGGRWLAVLDMGNGVQWMDAETGKLGLIGRHKASAARATFSPDGDWLFTGGWERELICWDARGRRRSFGISLDSPYFQISADGRRCAVTTRTHLQLYALDRPIAHREFEEDLGGLLRQAEFSLDGRWLAASAGERVGVWDLAGGGPGAVSEHGSNTRLFFTPDGGELFASRKPEGTPAAFRWRVSPATNPATAPPVLTRRPLRHPTGFTSLAMMSNLVVMTTTNGTQILAPDELETGASRWARTIAGITDVSPDRRWLGIYRSYGTELHIHQLPGLEPVARLKQSGIFGDFQFSPAGDEVAVCSTWLNRIDMWSTTTWERTRTLTNFGRLIYAPDGRGLWLSKDQRTAGLYDARTFKPLLLLPTGTLPLAVSPDGRHLAVSVDAQRLQLWNLGAVHEEVVRLGLDWEVR